MVISVQFVIKMKDPQNIIKASVLLAISLMLGCRHHSITLQQMPLIVRAVTR
jgi:hypothetical protein